MHPSFLLILVGSSRQATNVLPLPEPPTEKYTNRYTKRRTVCCWVYQHKGSWNGKHFKRKICKCTSICLSSGTPQRTLTRGSGGGGAGGEARGTVRQDKEKVFQIHSDMQIIKISIYSNKSWSQNTQIIWQHKNTSPFNCSGTSREAIHLSSRSLHQTAGRLRSLHSFVITSEDTSTAIGLGLGGCMLNSFCKFKECC